MTEKDIQYALYNYRLSISIFPIMIPNVYHYYWESDLLYISKAKYVTEYEIKISYSDFKADARKVTKHQFLANKGGGPSYFYYACPYNMIKISELPPYAGLFYINKRNKGHMHHTDYYATCVKTAPRRNTKPMTDKGYISALQKSVYKYWNIINSL